MELFGREYLRHRSKLNGKEFLAQFEKMVERTGRSNGLVDPFWLGKMVVEQIAHSQLRRCHSQAVACFV